MFSSDIQRIIAPLKFDQTFIVSAIIFQSKWRILYCRRNFSVQIGLSMQGPFSICLFIYLFISIVLFNRDLAKTSSVTLHRYIKNEMLTTPRCIQNSLHDRIIKYNPHGFCGINPTCNMHCAYRICTMHQYAPCTDCAPLDAQYKIVEDGISIPYLIEIEYCVTE